MKHRVRNGVTAAAIVLFLAACGGGGGGGSSAGGGGGTVPVVTPTATPPTSGSTSVTTGNNATTATLPNVGGFTGTLQVPAADMSATLEVLESTIPPAGVRGIMARTRDADAANTPYLYFELVSPDAVTLRGTLGFTLTLPSAVDANQSFWLAALFSDGTWGTLAGPATVANRTITLSTPLTLTYPGGGDAGILLGVYAGARVYNGAPIVVQPSSIALMDLSAKETMTIGGADPNATYTVNASPCAGIATATQTSPTTYTIGATALGSCNLVVSDNHGNSVSVYVAVSTTTVVIQ